MVTATARAIAQLAVVGLVIAVIFRTPSLAPLYLVVVLVSASHTSSRRLRAAGLAFLIAMAAIGGATAVVGLVVFASRALAWEPRSAVPFLVQLVGGSMTVTTLAGQRMIDDVTAGWDEVEGWLALGAQARQAVAQPARRAAARAPVAAAIAGGDPVAHGSWLVLTAATAGSAQPAARIRGQHP